MAAAPKNGLIILQGRSGKQYSYNFYASDVANAPITWSTIGAAGTGSSNFIIVPEDCMIADMSVATGLTDTANLVPYVNDVPAGVVVADANIVNTIQTRAFPRIGFQGGRKLQFVQTA